MPAPYKETVVRPMATMVLSLFVAGCTTVRVPHSDSTPPTIRLGTIGLDDDVLVTSASDDVELEVDRFARFTVIATAEDRNGGVANVSLFHSQTVYCPGRSSHGDGYRDNPATGIVGTTVPVTRAVAKAITMPDIIEDARSAWCEDLSSIEFTFRGIAQNFHDGRADSARITVNYYLE